MRILMLAWEFPPLVVGGLGRHVGALATQLATDGHDVRVVTRGDAPVTTTGDDAGVQVVRAAVDPLALDFTTESLVAWAQANEHSMLRAGLSAVRHWTPDVVHAHDWLAAQSAITLAEVTGAPLVSTVHATECGRHQGWLPAPLNRAIHSIERWLVARSAAVIVCAHSMTAEVVGALSTPAPRVHVVPNGLDPARWRPSAEGRSAARLRLAPEGPLLAVAGRLVHEKGVQTLISALPLLRRRHAGLRLVVAGRGPYRDELRALASHTRVARAVTWLGFVPEAELADVLAAADALVVPSFYEPFGLVALEGAACATPVVVAATGGLTDLIEDGTAAASFPPGDIAGLVEALESVLADPGAARDRAARIATRVQRERGWPAVAADTVAVYRRALTSA